MEEGGKSKLCSEALYTLKISILLRKTESVNTEMDEKTKSCAAAYFSRGCVLNILDIYTSKLIYLAVSVSVSVLSEGI